MYRGLHKLENQQGREIHSLTRLLVDVVWHLLIGYDVFSIQTLEQLVLQGASQLHIGDAD